MALKDLLKKTKKKAEEIIEKQPISRFVSNLAAGKGVKESFTEAGRQARAEREIERLQEKRRLIKTGMSEKQTEILAAPKEEKELALNLGTGLTGGLAGSLKKVSSMIGKEAITRTAKTKQLSEKAMTNLIDRFYPLKKITRN